MQNLSFRKRMFLGLCLFVSVAAMLACFVPAFLKAKDIVMEWGEKRGENKFAKMPDFDYDRIVAIKEYAVKGNYILQEPKNAEDFIRAERAVTYYNLGIDKFIKQRNIQMTFGSQGDHSPYMARGVKDDINQTWGQYQAKYQNRWTAEELDRARARGGYWTGYDPNSWTYHEPQKSWSEFLMMFVPLLGFLLLGYLGAALCSNIYFVPSLKAHGYSWKEILWGEFCSFNLPAANLAFPMMLPVFPWGNPAEHMKQSMRRVATALSVFLIHALPGAIEAYGKRKQAEPVEGHEITLVTNNVRPILDDPKLLFFASPSPTATLTATPTATPTPASTASSNNWVPSVTAQTVAKSKYVGLNGAVFHKGPVLHSEVTFTWSNGLYAGVWNSKSIGPPLGGVNFGNETDVFFGWSGKKHRINIDAGGSIVAVTPFSRVDNDVIQLYLRAGRTFQLQHNNKIEPYVHIRHFEPVNKGSSVPGTFVQTGLSHSYANGRFGVSSYGETLVDNGAFGFDNAVILRTGGETTWAISRKLKLLFSFNFSTPLTPVTDGRKPEFVYGLGAKFAF